MATEKLDGKGFTLKGLAPNATYVIQVKAIPKDGNNSEWSRGVKFNTNGKNVAPPGITSLTASFDGTGFVASWDGSSAKSEKDFSYFKVIITSSNSPLITKTYSVQSESFSLDRDSILFAFNSLVTSITIEVRSVDTSGNESSGVSVTAENEPPAAPTNVSVTTESMGYSVTWDVPPESDYAYSKIYESSTESGTYTQIETATATPALVKVFGYDARYVKVSHVDTFGGESDLAPTTGLEVTPTNPVSVDTDPPDQRTAISYSSGIGSIIVSWTNPTDSATNSDVAGIIIRYAKTASPTNYTWVTVPFTFSSPLTTATVENLLPLTSYDFSIATFDQTQNRTSYSSTYTITTSADATPPPQPVSPTVAAGTSAGGPLVIRVTQESVENIVGNPALPLDTSYFKVFMLDHSYTTEPALGVSADANASEIGTITAAFNGGTSQNNFYVPLVDQETRYFYTRAVDTSGNISDASPASQSSSMVVIDSAYISDLSADKITAGRLNATEYIQVGTSSEQVTIESTASLGKIYSGVGTYNNSNTGFYVDSSGQFSLKDRLTFDGTDLALEGSITATGGAFTGNVQLDGGSLFAGASSSSGARVIMNQNGLTAYNSSNVSTFTIDAATGNAQITGEVRATSGYFGSNVYGWEIVTGIDNGTNYTSIETDTVKIRSNYSSAEGHNGSIEFWDASNSSFVAEIAMNSKSKTFSTNGLGAGVTIGTSADYLFIPGTANNAKSRFYTNGLDFYGPTTGFLMKFNNDGINLSGTSKVNFYDGYSSTSSIGANINFQPTTNYLVIESIGELRLVGTALKFNGVDVTGGGGGGGVTSFNTRTGTVTLTTSDVTGLGTGWLDGSALVGSSVANGKLANSTITIGSTTVSLGGTFSNGTIDGSVLVGSSVGSGKLTGTLFTLGGTAITPGDTFTTITGGITLGGGPTLQSGSGGMTFENLPPGSGTAVVVDANGKVYQGSSTTSGTGISINTATTPYTINNTGYRNAGGSGGSGSPPSGGNKITYSTTAPTYTGTDGDLHFTYI